MNRPVLKCTQKCIVYLPLYAFGVKCGLPYLGKATAAAKAALPNPMGACWVFLFP